MSLRPLSYEDRIPGWYPVAFSRDLERNTIRRARLHDEDLICYRTASGAVRVATAWCPHLGADLSVRGRIVGENLRCAFHGWQFGPDGRPDCHAAPESGRAALKVFPVVERNGVVHVWLHPRGAPPSWEIPALPALRDGPGSTRILARPLPSLALAEQAFDLAHFQTIHSLTVDRESVRMEESPHQLRLQFRVTRSFGPLAVPIHFDMRQMGPGLCVYDLSTGPITLHFYSALAPVGRGACHNFLGTSLSLRGVGHAQRPVAELTMFLVLNFFDSQDGDVLEARNYDLPPSYGPLDGPLIRLRRWLAALRDEAMAGAAENA